MKIVHSFRRALGRNKRRLHHEPVCSKLNMYIGCNLFRSDPLKMVLSWETKSLFAIVFIIQKGIVVG